MSEEKSNNQTRFNSIWFITPYLFGIGLIYMMAYWPSFNVNPLQYADLPSLVTICIIPIFESSTSFLIGLVGGVLLHSRTSGTFNYSTGMAPVVKVAIAIWTITSTTVLIYIATLLQNDAKWKVLPFLTLISILPVGLALGLLKGWVPAKYWETMLIVILYLPMSSYCTGKLNALDIIRSKEYMETMIDGRKLRLVGHLSDKFFLVNEKNDNLVIINDSQMKFIDFKKIKPII